MNKTLTKITLAAAITAASLGVSQAQAADYTLNP
jgi:spermidine/putrescine-binding protein